jgi:hypothetical protein
VLNVSDEAKEYILIEKKAVYLLQTGRTSLCCGNIDFGPSVFLGNPSYCVFSSKFLHQCSSYDSGRKIFRD